MVRGLSLPHRSPELARFLVQIESSPYSRIHHEGLEAQEPPDPLIDAARQPDMAARLLHLPLEVLFDLGLAPAIRLAAAGADMSETDLTTVAHACWRAISLPWGGDRQPMTSVPTA